MRTGTGMEREGCLALSWSQGLARAEKRGSSGTGLSVDVSKLDPEEQ